MMATEVPQSEIDQYGGKAAILNHIRRRLPRIPILPYTLGSYGTPLECKSAELETLKWPLIVRSSSPYEFADFEGIFASFPDVQRKGQLQVAQHAVESSARSEKAQQYAQQHGFTIDDRIHCFAQEQSKAELRGGMLRHPNDPSKIFMTLSNPGPSGRALLELSPFDEAREARNNRLKYAVVFNEETGEIRQSYAKLDPEFVRLLVRDYNELEGIGIVPGYSLFTEIGADADGKNYSVFQVRPFKPICTADFDVSRPAADGQETLWVDSNLCFGITPEEGIELPVLRGLSWFTATALTQHPRKLIAAIKPEGEGMRFRDFDTNLGVKLLTISEGIPIPIDKILAVHNREVGGDIEGPYCYLTSHQRLEDYDVDLTVPGMKTFVADVDDFIVHEAMRLIKQADVTVHVPCLERTPLYQQMVSLTDRVRIISNGKRAIVTRVPGNLD